MAKYKLRNICSGREQLLKDTETYLSGVSDGTINMASRETLHKMVDKLYDYICETNSTSDDIFCNKAD
jgi:hypothetical protein